MGLNWWYLGSHCSGPASSFHGMKTCWVTQMWNSAGCSSSVGEKHRGFLSVLVSCLPCLHCGPQTVRSKDRLEVSSPNVPLKIMAYLLPHLPFPTIKINVVVKWKYLQKDEDLVLPTCMLLEGGYCFHWSGRICIIQLDLFLVNKQISGKLGGCYQRHWEKASDCGVPWMSGFSILGWGSILLRKPCTHFS